MSNCLDSFLTTKKKNRKVIQLQIKNLFGFLSNCKAAFKLVMSGGQEIEFHEIEIIIFLNWSGDRKGPRCPQGARLGYVKGQVRLGKVRLGLRKPPEIMTP